MKKIWIYLLTALLGFSHAYADVIYNDLSSSPIVADTGSSSSTTPTTSSLYINLAGDVSTSNPSGLDVFFTAYRDRDVGGWPLYLTQKVEEYVNFSSGLCLTPISEGLEINNSLNFSGGNILYQIDSSNPNNQYYSAGFAYYGFRISDGNGDYFYGWAEVKSEIQTYDASILEFSVIDENAAKVTINRVALMDIAGEFIDAGQTVPEPAVMALISMAGGISLLFRRRFLS